MMTLSDEEANSKNNTKKEFKVPDERKDLLCAWYFDGKSIQYSDKIKPTEDDWIDYIKSDFPAKGSFIMYKWRLKPEPPVKRCRLALVELNGKKNPLLVNDYDSAKVLETQMCDEKFIRWLTDWIIWMND